MEILGRINWVDILVIILVLRVSYVAYQEGLSQGIAPTVGTALILIFSLHYYPYVGGLISQYLFKMPAALANFVSFFAIIVVLGIICKVLSSLLAMVVKMEWLPAIERWGGLAIGFVKACLISMIIISLLALAPLPYLQKSIRDKSLVGLHILKAGTVMYARVCRLLPPMGGGLVPPSQEVLFNNLAADKKIPR
jgi:uncharacterized membrane protein required for colicin V production